MNMEQAIIALDRVDPHNTIYLWQDLCDVYKNSFAIIPVCIDIFGKVFMHKWIPTFQNYQTILASAIQYLATEIARENLASKNEYDSQLRAARQAAKSATTSPPG